jgi:transposase
MILVNISDIEKGDLHERERLLLHLSDCGGARRCRMVIMSANGFSVPQIAKALSVCKQTVRRAIKTYLKEGMEALTTKPRAGAPKKLTSSVIDFLENLARQAPRNLVTDDPDYESNTWTLSMLTDYLRKYHRLCFGQTSVYRALKGRKIRFGRPKHTVTSPDPAYQAKKDYRDQLIAVIVSPNARVDTELKNYFQIKHCCSLKMRP